MSRLGGLLVASYLFTGCLEGGEKVPTTPSKPSTPGPVGLPEAFARASGALEADAVEPDEAALVLCADEGYACFAAGERSPSACLDDYIACAVQSGVPADHDYLVCLGALSGCWLEVGTSEEADACYSTYDDCIGDATQRPEPGDPGEPNDPGDEPTEPEGPLEACAHAADDCLIGVDPADGPAQARCLDTYAECLVEAGVPADEPYLGCLAQTRGCLLEDQASAESAEVCWYGFQLCYEDNYGGLEPHPDPDPEPNHGTGESVCETETYACYDAGGSNLECLGVLETCLLEEGVPEDHPYMDCLEELIACVGPAEARYDEAALEVCAETFNQCAEASR